MHTRICKRGVAAACLLFACALLAGCSDSARKYEVSGALTIDGAVPPDGASITFIPTDGKSTTEGCTVQNGKYTTKVMPGNYKVEIRAPRVSGKPKQPAAKGGYQTEGQIIEEMLPAKFNDQTELTFEVKAETNIRNWDLKTK